jgi:hypothetical protein
MTRSVARQRLHAHRRGLQSLYPVAAGASAACLSSWFGFAPQNLVMPAVLAALFAARRLRVEALLVLGSQGAHWFFGVAFFFVYVLAHNSIRRTAGLVLLSIPIVLVGPSRLYLGQHWLSDVIGGYAVAAMLLVPYCWAYATWRLDATRRRFTHPASAHAHRLAVNETSLARHMRKRSQQP